MDIKQLLEKMEEFAGEKVGQKPGEQWKGTDKGTPGKKLVGDSIIKDLSKGRTPKTKEQELAEEWANFNEEDLGTHPKRPGRKSDRHSRGHEPQPRYKTVKADESAMSEKDIELQDYRSMSHKEFQTAYSMTKTEWINKNKALVIQNPKLKQALGLEEGEETAPAALADPIVATVVKQMRPGLTGLDMGNEAFLYFAYELGKQRARDAWSDYLPAIRHAYEKDLNEDKQEDSPVEARWMVKVSDDEGDHLKTYHRKFPSLSAAKKAYKNTPYATDFKYKPVKQDQVEEAVVGQDSFNRAGYNPIRDERDYLKKLSDLSNLSRKPGLDQQMKDQIKQRILDLNAEARKKGFIQAESRGHNIIANKLKDVERAKKFASGELKIPTPQERQAQLAKQEPKKEKVDEYGADNPAQTTTQKASPAQAQQVAANLNTQKTALGQLKQINPEIDPQKAAMAVTKDVATMSPQEKEELAQVAKTLSPALGTPALGPIKTAIQKSQLQAKK